MAVAYYTAQGKAPHKVRQRLLCSNLPAVLSRNHEAGRSSGSREWKTAAGGKIMKQEVSIKTEVTKEIYGNVLLSFLMGVSSIAGIWYLSSFLIVRARHYS